MTRVALVPGVLALLPEYAGLDDPVAELRAACLRAVAWLGEAGPVSVAGTPQGVRVARHLLHAAGVSTSSTDGDAVLVVGNGSARRTEKAPGFLDDRASGFDEALGRALREATFDADLALADELLADVEAMAQLSRIAAGAGPAQVDYDDDPFGVQYWVMRWES